MKKYEVKNFLFYYLYRKLKEIFKNMIYITNKL